LMWVMKSTNVYMIVSPFFAFSFEFIIFHECALVDRPERLLCFMFFLLLS
jgi:hypothetical protein